MTVFLKMFENFLKGAIFIKLLWIGASKFIGNSYISHPLLRHLYMVKWGKWVRGWSTLKINLSIIGCDGLVVRYGFVGRVDSQSIFMTVNLFLLVHYNIAFN